MMESALADGGDSSPSPRRCAAECAGVPARRERRREVPAPGGARRPPQARGLARGGVARRWRSRTPRRMSATSRGRSGAAAGPGARPDRDPSDGHRASPRAGRRGHDDRAARDGGPQRPDRRQLPDRRVGGHRRLDRDRRRLRGLSVRVDRPDPAGSQVSRRGDAAGHRPPEHLPRVRHDPPGARAAAAA